MLSAALQLARHPPGAGGRVVVTGTVRKQFFVEIFFEIFFRKIANPTETYYRAPMTFYSLPFTPERVEATEARLEAIYEAAKYGLKGDSLAMRAGLTPAQYRRLQEFDPLVEMAELKGRADGEWMAAKTLHEAAAEGDAKAALDILKHQHGWVSKQSVEVSVEGQISVIAALEKAQRRVIEAQYAEVESAPTPSTLLTNQQEEFVDGYQLDNARTPEKSTDV
jgi:hypothetical protein